MATAEGTQQTTEGQTWGEDESQEGEAEGAQEDQEVGGPQIENGQQQPPLPEEEAKESGASELDQKDQLIKWHCKYNPMKKFVCTFGEREPTDAEMFVHPDNQVLPEPAGLGLPELDQGELTVDSEPSGAEASEGDSSEPEDSQSTVTDFSSEEGLPEMRGLPEDDETSLETVPEAGEAEGQMEGQGWGEGESDDDSDTDSEMKP